jgi:hypothetical protein
MAGCDAEQQLILLSAGTVARRSAMREQAVRLAREVDWRQFAETLRSRKLLSTLGPRVMQLAEATAAADFAAAVDDAIESGRRQGAFLQLTLLRVMAMLADAGIRSAPLKGPLLGEAIYGEPGRRLSSDIDLLVAPEQLPRAVEVARQLGYGDPLDPVEDNGLPLLHFALAHERGELPLLELHWRIHWYEQSFASERLLPPTAQTAAEWRPAPADELAALLLFYARDGFQGLRLATDLSAWWDTFGGQLRPGALNQVIHAHPALRRALVVASAVCERTVGIPAGPLISGTSEERLRRRLAVRLVDPDPHASAPQLHANMGVIDLLLIPTGGLRSFIRRQLLPPHDVLEERARGAQGRQVSSRLGHGTRVLVRYGLTVLRLGRASPVNLPDRGPTELRCLP